MPTCVTVQFPVEQYIVVGQDGIVFVKQFISSKHFVLTLISESDQVQVFKSLDTGECYICHAMTKDLITEVHDSTIQ